MRKPLIAGNWKCHTTLREAAALVEQVKRSCQLPTVEAAVFPPFPALSSAGQWLDGSTIRLGAQDVFWEPQGAFTGEVSPRMLVDVGCRFVIIGHSERRTLFGETDETVRRKLLAVLREPLTPIVCIGETLAERDANRTFDVITRQLTDGLQGLAGEQAGQVIVAYEPLWAIGTGRNATPEQAQEAHAFVRQRLANAWGKETAQAIRILYGGSVNGTNAESLLAQPDVDGALVGGASLKAESFSAIVKAAAEAKTVRR